MKTLTITLLLLSSLFLTGLRYDKLGSTKPKATYLVGSAKVTVWENKKTDGTIWKNFQVEKIYKKGGKWLSSNSFTDTELLELRAVIDKTVLEENVKTK